MLNHFLVYFCENRASTNHLFFVFVYCDIMKVVKRYQVHKFRTIEAEKTVRLLGFQLCLFFSTYFNLHNDTFLTLTSDMLLIGLQNSFHNPRSHHKNEQQKCYELIRKKNQNIFLLTLFCGVLI